MPCWRMVRYSRGAAFGIEDHPTRAILGGVTAVFLNSLARVLFILVGVLGLTGCQGIRYLVPQHSREEAKAPLTMVVGKSFTALKTPARMPVPGGFWLGLASEDAEVVAVETVDGAMGSSRVILHARREGAARLHYVNRFVVAGDALTTAEADRLRSHSLEAFTVTVLPAP